MGPIASQSSPLLILAQGTRQEMRSGSPTSSMWTWGRPMALAKPPDQPGRLFLFDLENFPAAWCHGKGAGLGHLLACPSRAVVFSSVTYGSGGRRDVVQFIQP